MDIFIVKATLRLASQNIQHLPARNRPVLTHVAGRAKVSRHAGAGDRVAGRSGLVVEGRAEEALRLRDEVGVDEAAGGVEELSLRALQLLGGLPVKVAAQPAQLLLVHL